MDVFLQIFLIPFPHYRLMHHLYHFFKQLTVGKNHTRIRDGLVFLLTNALLLLSVVFLIEIVIIFINLPG